MNSQKSLIQEQAVDSSAIKDSRSTPIQQETQDRSMDFIRNFILGIPTQELRETEAPVEQPVQDTSDLDTITRLAGIK